MKKLSVYCFMLLVGISVSSFKSVQQTTTVYIYATVTSADVKATAFSDIFRITVEKSSAYNESSEKHSAAKKMENNFKKYMYINESWDKYVSTGSAWADSRSELEEKRLKAMESEKRRGYKVTSSLFSFSYSAGDAYRNY